MESTNRMYELIIGNLLKQLGKDMVEGVAAVRSFSSSDNQVVASTVVHDEGKEYIFDFHMTEINPGEVAEVV